MKTRSLVVMVAAVGVGGLLLTGCDKKEPVTFYQAPKEPAHTDAPGHDHASHGGMEQPQAAEIAFNVPTTWKELPPVQMRYAGFAISNDTPPLAVTVSSLGLAGSGLESNVARWAGQVGVDPATLDLTKVVTRSEVNGTTAELVDLLGPEKAEGRQRMRAVILRRPDKAWFVKLMGPAEKVEAKQGEFDAFVKSITFPEAGMPSVVGPAVPAAGAGAGASGDGLTYDTPAGWRKDALVEGGMIRRAASFHAGEKGDEAEVIVTRLGSNVGDLASNIARWQGQVGLAGADPAAVKPTETVVGSGKGQLYEFLNPQSNKLLLVVRADRGQDVWFFKIIGSADVVSGQKAAFDAFLKSVKFE